MIDEIVRQEVPALRALEAFKILMTTPSRAWLLNAGPSGLHCYSPATNNGHGNADSQILPIFQSSGIFCCKQLCSAAFHELTMRIKFHSLGSSVLLLISFSLALLSPWSVAAQGDEKEKAQKEDERRQELERKTLAMLDEIAAQALSLKLPENRSLVLANAADLLWTHDEKRARSLFWDALNNLTPPIGPAEDGSTVSESTTKDSKPKESTAKDSTTKRSTNDKAQSLNQYFATFQLRQEFLRKVARRDPQLAIRNALCRSRARAWRRVSRFRCLGLCSSSVGRIRRWPRSLPAM
jgi:hypothetical protein